MPEFFNLIGLAMIPAVMWLAADVVGHYWPRLSRRKISDYEGEDLLMLGVVIGFGLTAIVNVAYWGSHFLGQAMGLKQWTEATYIWGQAANVFTRYAPYVLAAMLHLGAGWKYQIPGVQHPRYYAIRTVALMAACYIILEVTRP